MGDRNGDGYGEGGMAVVAYGDGVSTGTANGNGWGAGIRYSDLENRVRYLQNRQEGSGGDPDD